MSGRTLLGWFAVTLYVTCSAWAQEPSIEGERRSSRQEAPAAAEPKEESGDPRPEDERLDVYELVEVRERADDLSGLTRAASEGTTGFRDLQRRPIQRAGELVETAPGVIATQHSGGGKANQYFLRGFNLDHGTDFRISVSGAPVNMPSHGHGQGYADLSFLIPELVDRVTYRKGTYYADTGDFSAAGSVDMRLRRDLNGGVAQVSAGDLGFERVLVADSFRAARGDLVAALDVSQHDGPWTRPDDFRKTNAIVSYVRGDASRGFSLSAMGYDGEWLSTDQIPRREVEAGRLGRFDLLDDGPRGSTERFQLSGEIRRGSDRSLTTLSGYVLSYDFRLISNFTYFLEDPERGDQFEQIDDRIVIGLAWHHERLGSFAGRPLESRFGFDLRRDDIDNGLFRTRDLERFGTVRQDSIEQLGAGLWADASVRWSDTVRTTIGLRADYYDADVVSDLAVNSGAADDLLLSPKFALLLGPFDGVEYFLNLGWGFHSNDARGSTIRVDPVSGEPANRVQPLVQARGAEVGMRASVAGWTTAVALFGLELDSELVFVGDGGATEASRPSRRTGIEWNNFWRVNRKLSFDADLTWTDAEFTDPDPAGGAIPGAIGRTVAAGVAVDDLGRFSGGLRWRYFSDIPLIEDGSVVSRSSSVVNAVATYRLSPQLDLRLEGLNLLDREASDIQYFYASRLPGEPVGGVEDVHFHPMEPRSGRLTLSWRF